VEASSWRGEEDRFRSEKGEKEEGVLLLLLFLLLGEENELSWRDRRRIFFIVPSRAMVVFVVGGMEGVEVEVSHP
jgi:hypothetical protein